MGRSETLSHEQALELLPWLVNDALGTDERERVGQHARNCVICRRELAELEKLQASISRSSDSMSIPAPDMRRINARIDADLDRRNRIGALVPAMRDFFASPWRTAFAVQSVLLVALGAVLFWPQSDDPGFTTLTARQALPEGQYVRVVFDPRSETASYSALLERLQLTIIDGPSERGVATLRISATVAEAERDTVVADLLASSHVLFAEPVTSGVD